MSADPCSRVIQRGSGTGKQLIEHGHCEQKLAASAMNETVPLFCLLKSMSIYKMWAVNCDKRQHMASCLRRDAVERYLDWLSSTSSICFGGVGHESTDVSKDCRFHELTCPWRSWLVLRSSFLVGVVANYSRGDRKSVV